MTWLADDSQAGTEVMLSLPRVAPAGAGAVAAWLAGCAPRGPARPSRPGPGARLRCPRAVALRGRRPSRRRHARRVAGRASAADHRRGGVLDGGGAARAGLRPRCRCRPSRPAIPHPAGQRARSDRGDGARRGAREHRGRRAEPRQRPGDAARPFAAARPARRRRARRARLRPPAASPARRRAGARRRRHRPGDRASGAARPRVRAPALDHAASDPRAAAGDRQPQHRRAASPALPQRPHLPRRDQRLARGARPTTTAARSRSCSIACAPSATCRRCPGSGRGCSGSRRSRASAPTRSRRICCPTWRCRSSCCARSTPRRSRARRSPATARC